MKILITGALGFVGSHLTEKYVNEGHTVIGVDSLFSGSAINVKHVLDCINFRLELGDIRDKEFLLRLMDGVDCVFHLAAQVHVGRSMTEPEMTWDINVNGTQNVLETARSCGVKKIIHASSSEVYGSAQFVPMDGTHPLDAPHPYGASKTAGDRMCFAYQRTYNMDIVIVRPFNIFGPRQRDDNYGGVVSIFARMILQDIPPVVYGDGSQGREYTYVTDVVDAYDRIMKYTGSISIPINIGSGEEITIKRLAYKLIEICGKKFAPVFVEARVADLDRLVVDASKAKELLGWKPTVSIEEGLHKLVEWYRTDGVDRLIKRVG